MPVMFGHNMPEFDFAAMPSRPSITPTSVIISIAVVTFLRSAYYRHFHPLSKVPGIDSRCQKCDARIALSHQQVHSWPQSLVYGTLDMPCLGNALRKPTL
jgi:hypothetical protein